MTKQFYTSVVRYGNKLLYRGYDDKGLATKERIPFKPTLFMSGESDEGWTTLDGLPMQPVVFDSMADAKDFNKRYENVSNFNIAGNTNYSAQFIAEEWPERIDYDRSLIKTANIDIEVYSEEVSHNPKMLHILSLLSLCARTLVLTGSGDVENIRTLVKTFFIYSVIMRMILSVSSSDASKNIRLT